MNSDQTCSKIVLDCKCNKGVKEGKGCNNSGQCDCKPNFTGVKCDQCATGYFDFQHGCKGVCTLSR